MSLHKHNVLNINPVLTAKAMKLLDEPVFSI